MFISQWRCSQGQDGLWAVHFESVVSAGVLILDWYISLSLRLHTVSRHAFLCLSWNRCFRVCSCMYIYIYICVCVCTHVYVYCIYLYDTSTCDCNIHKHNYILFYVHSIPILSTEVAAATVESAHDNYAPLDSGGKIRRGWIRSCEQGLTVGPVCSDRPIWVGEHWDLVCCVCVYSCLCVLYIFIWYEYLWLQHT